MEILQGEQFTRYITGDNIDYDLCSQIVLSIYNNATGVVALNFVKVNDADYPTAPLLQKSENASYKLKIFLSQSMTKGLPVGEYYIEAKRVISGVSQPIVKSSTAFLTVKKSRTK